MELNVSLAFKRVILSNAMHVKAGPGMVTLVHPADTQRPRPLALHARIGNGLVKIVLVWIVQAHTHKHNVRHASLGSGIQKFKNVLKIVQTVTILNAILALIGFSIQIR